MTDPDFSTPAVPHAQSVQPLLAYETSEAPDHSGSRPRWVYGVFAIYGILSLGVLTAPLWANWATNSATGGDVAVPATVVAVCLAGSGLSLMILPVRVARRRRITKRSIWIPLIFSGILAGVLGMGACMALCEFLEISDSAGLAALIAGCAVWTLWTVIFVLIANVHGPQSIGMKLHRGLIVGSVVELLIAVPTHIIVRRRAECCAGMLTGVAICIGVAVMLVSFGPSVLLLYYRRRKQITR